MAKRRESDNGENVAGVCWKLLLYPDNEIHLSVMDNIERLYPDSFLYCQHRNYDEDGHVITEGSGKLHVHYGLITDIVDRKRAIRRGSLCKLLGLVDESGLPEFRFLRPVYGRMCKFLPYLTHRNSPDKEQYPDSELVGSPLMMAEYRKGAIEYEGQLLEVRECVSAVLEWIWSHDKKVSYSDFAKWICKTPFFRVRNDRLVVACLEEHNARIAQREFEAIQNSQPAYQEQLQMVSGGRSVWLGDTLTNLDDCPILF